MNKRTGERRVDLVLAFVRSYLKDNFEKAPLGDYEQSIYELYCRLEAKIPRGVFRRAIAAKHPWTKCTYFIRYKGDDGERMLKLREVNRPTKPRKHG